MYYTHKHFWYDNIYQQNFYFMVLRVEPNLRHVRPALYHWTTSLPIADIFKLPLPLFTSWQLYHVLRCLLTSLSCQLDYKLLSKESKTKNKGLYSELSWQAASVSSEKTKIFIPENLKIRFFFQKLKKGKMEAERASSYWNDPKELVAYPEAKQQHRCGHSCPALGCRKPAHAQSLLPELSYRCIDGFSCNREERKGCKRRTVQEFRKTLLQELTGKALSSQMLLPSALGSSGKSRVSCISRWVRSRLDWGRHIPGGGEFNQECSPQLALKDLAIWGPAALTGFISLYAVVLWVREMKWETLDQIWWAFRYKAVFWWQTSQCYPAADSLPGTIALLREPGQSWLSPLRTCLEVLMFPFECLSTGLSVASCIVDHTLCFALLASITLTITTDKIY